MSATMKVFVLWVLMGLGMGEMLFAQDSQAGQSALVLYSDMLAVPGLRISVDASPDSYFLAPGTRLEIPLSEGIHSLSILEAVSNPFLQRLNSGIITTEIKFDDSIRITIGKGKNPYKVAFYYKGFFTPHFTFKASGSSYEEIALRYAIVDPALLETWRMRSHYWLFEMGYLPVTGLDLEYNTFNPLMAGVGSRWILEAQGLALEVGARLMSQLDDRELLAGISGSVKLFIFQLECGLMARLRDASDSLLQYYGVEYTSEWWFPFMGSRAEFPIYVKKDLAFLVFLETLYLDEYNYTLGSDVDPVLRMLLAGLCVTNFKFVLGMRVEL